MSSIPVGGYTKVASGALSIWCISSIETEEARLDHLWKRMGNRCITSVLSYFMGECRKDEARISWRCTVLGGKAMHFPLWALPIACPWLYSELGWTRLWAKLELNSLSRNSLIWSVSHSSFYITKPFTLQGWFTMYKRALDLQNFLLHDWSVKNLIFLLYIFFFWVILLWQVLFWRIKTSSSTEELLSSLTKFLSMG